MATRVAINGFGRIGRQSLKAMLERYPDDIEVVAVNFRTDIESNARLFRHDSTYGRFNGSVEVAGESFVINGKRIRVFSYSDPGSIPWGEAGVEIVIESTGAFTDASKAAAHRRDSVKKVIVTAPAEGEDITIVMGVNEDRYNPTTHNIISNASCTTNCLAPAAMVINDTFGIERGLVTTVHSYTNDQRILDVAHTSLRHAHASSASASTTKAPVRARVARARSAAANIVPTTTGAALALARVIPELKGKLDGLSLRMPTTTVSVVDFVATVRKTASAEQINAAFKAAAAKLKGILDYTDEPLISTDFRGDSHSSIIDGLSTMSLGGDFIKVIAWYDNEWGYSSRVADLTHFIAERL